MVTGWFMSILETTRLWNLLGGSKGREQKYRLHPLIHTLLEFNVAQDFGGCQGGGSVGEEDSKGVRGWTQAASGSLDVTSISSTPMMR
jgi:hypothetical protein